MKIKDSEGYSWQTAVELLRGKGIVLRQLPGSYGVYFRGGAAATSYQTDDLDDAVAHGLTMGTMTLPEPPLGPTGNRQTARGRMYRHNRKLAARRRQSNKGRD